ncbi:MAG TPA: CBS domain-containing protein [candidate division Zixibacteria bacterium]|nr:CBS domain-containing protein [candidate division Zixibacteria bacterium]
MLVKTLLKTKPRRIITVHPAASVDEAMELLIANGIGCLPVVDDTGALTGIVSDKDIFRKIHELKGEYHQLRVMDVMTSEIMIGLPSDDITYIANVMEKNWIRHVPIVEDEKIVGLVSLRDIIKTLAASTDIENRYLSMYMDGLHSRDRSADA